MLLCRNCGWVRKSSKKGRPYCSVAKKLYRGTDNRAKQRHEQRKALRKNACEVCGGTENLQLDHDHSCCAEKSCKRCYRGTLCRTCNSAEGHISSAMRRGVLEALIQYVETRSLDPQQ